MPTLYLRGKPFVYTHHFSVLLREVIVEAREPELPAGVKTSLERNLILEFCQFRYPIRRIKGD